jgi:hypothetical protein
MVENLYIKAGNPTPDFSEQYMQWAVKTQLGDFPNTEGSSAQSNLRTVVKYGTVEEAVWPYQIDPWTAANDPACTGGNNLPTKCYTNGAPPTAAASATKFKLPAVEFVNVNSIKAHIVAKQTAVAVGITFFFQSWNHRLSTLPVSSALWAQGAVTYPNAKDKELSLAEHEGHAILVVGWDDNLEIASRDEQGNPVLGTDGQPVKEKGFWIIKNSWNTNSFGAQNPYGAGYGFLSYKYVAEFGSAVSAEIPTLDTDPCVVDPASCTPTGTMHTYSATPAAAIPDNSSAGASSTIHVTDTGTLASVKVTTDVTHTYRGDLTVTLTHGTVSKVIFNRTGGGADDLKQAFQVSGFDGALAGDWTLVVKDSAIQDTGTFNAWTLEVSTH